MLSRQAAQALGIGLPVVALALLLWAGVRISATAHPAPIPPAAFDEADRNGTPQPGERPVDDTADTGPWLCAAPPCEVS